MKLFMDHLIYSNDHDLYINFEVQVCLTEAEYSKVTKVVYH